MAHNDAQPQPKAFSDTQAAVLAGVYAFLLELGQESNGPAEVAEPELNDTKIGDYELQQQSTLLAENEVSSTTYRREKLKKEKQQETQTHGNG